MRVLFLLVVALLVRVSADPCVDKCMSEMSACEANCDDSASCDVGCINTENLCEIVCVDGPGGGNDPDSDSDLPSDDNDQSRSDLVVGAITVVLIIVGLVLCFVRHQRIRRQRQEKDANTFYIPV